jgi:hypothetical protein
MGHKPCWEKAQLQIMEPFYLEYLKKYRHQTGNLQDFWMQVATALNEHHPVDSPDMPNYYVAASNQFPKSLITDEQLAAIVDPNVRDATRRERETANERRAEELMGLLVKVRVIIELHLLCFTHLAVFSESTKSFIIELEVPTRY